jgi:gamma-glutamylputrescine oxidase
MMQDVKESETWYEATAERGPPRPALSGTVEAEVCVIGGGLAGLTLARELAGAGRPVVLLEARRLAHGASGRNGGSVSHGFAEDIDAVAARLGLESAQQLFRLSAGGTAYVAQQIAEGDPSIRMGEGSIVAWRTNDMAGGRRLVERMQRDYGLSLELIGREELRLLLRSERYYLGIRNSESFHIHPLRYALMLASRAEAAGAKLHEQTPALAITREGGGWRVTTPGGAVRARHVALCVSALDRRLHRFTGRAILPIATYMIATERLKQDAITTRAMISDTRRASDYYRLSNDGRILWGARITTRVTAPQRLGEMLRQDLISVYPQLGRPRVRYAWAGLMGYALHKMPLIGRDHDGIWYATAFGGHGLNTTAMGGMLLARAITEGDDEYRRFAAFGPRWAMGKLGLAGVQGTYWWMQLRDRIDEARARRDAA